MTHCTNFLTKKNKTMKQENTVTISLKEYDELRDFKKAMEAGNTVRVFTTITDYTTFKEISFYHSSDGVEMVVKAKEELLERNSDLYSENYKLRNEPTRKGFFG